MSRATAFVDLISNRPRIRFAPDGVRMELNNDGGLYVDEPGDISSAQALELAQWLIDIFAAPGVTFTRSEEYVQP